MSLSTWLQELVDEGDPILRKWPLVQSVWTPFVLSTLYVIFVKQVGPAIMRNRKPFDFRLIMIPYNFGIVLVYSSCILAEFYLALTTNCSQKLCTPTFISPGSCEYYYAAVGWYLYLLKYIEFADTVFFILRKKFNLITNLHVIHHATLPLIAWYILRTETSGWQFIPASLNSFVHITMYTYYGLAAMGPKVQKFLWWKEYLTMLQMVQFVVILLFVLVVVPVSGCKTPSHGLYIDFFCAVLFLLLFMNFYKKTYKKSVSSLQYRREDGAIEINGEAKEINCTVKEMNGTAKEMNGTAKERNGLREKNDELAKNR